MYARSGIPRCPEHGVDLTAQTVSQMVDQVLKLPEGESCLLLAPLVAARKGEHHEVLADLTAQGFVRVRINGTAYEIDAAPELDPKRKHDIEAVVDRFKVRPDIAQRLAESFETALRLGNGVARLAFAHGKRDEITFSSRHACPVCGYSVGTLEPKLFSFNSPSGACPSCDGLGFQEFFDPQRVVTHPQLSLGGGAIRGWDRRNAYYFQMIRALATHYKFDIDAPWTTLPANVRNQLCSTAAATPTSNSSTRIRAVARPSARIPSRASCRTSSAAIGETESVTVREELGKYRGMRRCPECDGARLNVSARNVHVGGRSLPEISRLSVADAMAHYSELSDHRLARRNRGTHHQGSRRPPALPRRRGTRLPHARSQRRDPVRRRSAAHPAGQPGRLRAHRRAVHPRRALHRAAPARQPAPAGDAAAAARPGQHGDRRRARPGGHPVRGLRAGPRSRCGRARWRSGGVRHAGARSATIRSP